MNECDIIHTTAYRRRNTDLSNQEITSSIANLVEVNTSCETLSNIPGCGDLQKSKKTSKWAPFKGFIYTFICSFFITLSSVIVKKLTYISPGQLSLVRNAGVLVGNIPIVVYAWEHPLGPRSHRFLLLVRSFLGATALYVNLLAYRLLPLSEAAIIMSTLPAVVLVTARIFLKEPCGIVQTIALLITLTGVLLSIQLPEVISGKGLNSVFSSDDVTGILAAVGCVLLLSMTFVALRKMKDVHFSVVMVNLGLMGVIENAGITAAISYYSWPRCGLDVLWVLLVAIFGFVGNSSLTLAVQAEHVGIVSVIKASLDIFMAMILQYIFFGKSPDLYSIGGAVLVLISVTIIGFRKWLLEKPEGSSVRKRFKFFLF